MNRFRKIATSLLVIGVVVAAGIGASRAFFSDTETSNNNTFTAGSIDLALGSQFSSTANGNGEFELDSTNDGRTLYTFTDLKPGDWGTAVFDLQVTTNEAYVCAMSSIDSTPENGIVDPEQDAGDATGGVSGGELQNYVQFAIFHDANGNGQYDSVEPLNVNQFGGGDGNGFTAQQVADSGWIGVADTTAPDTWLAPLSSVQPSTVYNPGFMYCFGNFDANGVCTMADGDANDAQTDGISGSISFQAVQTRNNPDFVCSDLNEDEEDTLVGAALDEYVAPTCGVTVTGGSSIQTAVDTATDGDVVCVDSTYTGVGDTAAIRIENAGVTLAATVQGVDLFDPVVLSASNVTVTGFDGVIGQAESPAERAAFYLDNDADLFEVSFNTVTGGTGVGILTETGAALGGGLIANNVIDGASGAGIYTNPHTGVFVIEYNDIDNNAAGIGGLMGATVRYNEFAHTTAASEAIGIDSTFDSNIATINFNNFLNDVKIADYGATAVINAENNFFSSGGVNQTTTNADFDFTPEAGSAYAHN